MSKDFLDELGELALGSRLKRLSERMMTDAASIYQHFGIDVQPKWFTLLALLHRKDTVSVVSASEQLGLTQPAISQFCRQLLDKGLIDVKSDEEDARVKLMQLSRYGQKEVEKMLPMWRAVDTAAQELCSEFDNQFYQALLKFERALDTRSLKQRALENSHE